MIINWLAVALINKIINEPQKEESLDIKRKLQFPTSIPL
jgi:hypothetical protein